MADDNVASPDDELEGFPEFPEYAYSLFDEFKSTDAPEVYEHMEKNYGFKYNLLGRTMLHRVALVKYLQSKKDAKEDVLASYKELENNKALVMDKFQEYIRPPFNNEKLIWGFMESSDEEGDEGLLQDLMKSFPKTDMEGELAPPDGMQGDDPNTHGKDPFDMDKFDPENFDPSKFDPKDFNLPELPNFENLKELDLPDLAELEKLREQLERLRATDFPDMPKFPEFPKFPDADTQKAPEDS